MESTRPSKRLRFHWARNRPLTLFAPLLFFLAAIPAHAQAAGSDPWDNAVNVLKTAFTGPIATGLSLVAIVVGGLMFAYGEGQSKRMLAGIVFGIGMAVSAVKFLSISRKTVLALARSGQIPGHPIGDRKRRIWRFRLGELAAYIDSSTELNLDSHQGRVRERKVS